MTKIDVYKKEYGKIAIMIGTKNRSTEVALLLQSLRTSTYKEFDCFILDDASQNPLTNFYFFTYLAQRMKIEGHNITVVRNNISNGVSKMRQQLVDTVMANKFKYKLLMRLDDDIVVQPDYIEKLLDVIDKGYDLASGITTPIVGSVIKRESKFVEPIIGYCELDDKGELVYTGDDCGIEYLDENILPSPHFRSCALYKREIHEAGVDYENRLSKNGFREEHWFSWKIITNGFKIGVNTGAVNFHLLTPSGGERDTMNMTGFNEQMFEEYTKKLYEEKGDFLKEYYKRCNVVPRVLSKDEYLKTTNLSRGKHGAIQ